MRTSAKMSLIFFSYGYQIAQWLGGLCLEKKQQGHSTYTPAIDIWSIGCIFAEILTGKPLFPGKSVVHQLDIMTDLLGTPSPECISRIRNDKARRYLNNMGIKTPVPFSQKILNVDPRALRLLERLLAFDPRDRPTADEALSDSYFYGFTRAEKEASPQPISKLEFSFEKKKLRKDDVRELIYKEIVEYHPKMLEEYTLMAVVKLISCIQVEWIGLNSSLRI